VLEKSRQTRDLTQLQDEECDDELASVGSSVAERQRSLSDNPIQMSKASSLNLRASMSRAESPIMPSVSREEGTPQSQHAVDEDSPPQAADKTPKVVVFESEAERCSLRIPVVTNEPLNISLEEFHARFIADNAPNSWMKYHELVKDSNIVATTWTQKEDQPQGEWRRELKFFKPVNLPGLKSTRGIKYQSLRMFPGQGCVVCSSTWLEDVPAAKSFSVDDVLVVASDGSCVRVSISFEVKFIQATMFKYVIESSVNSEMSKWLEAFFAHLKSVSADPTAAVPIVEAPGYVQIKGSEEEATHPHRDRGLEVLLLVLILLVVLASWVSTHSHESVLVDRIAAMEDKLDQLLTKLGSRRV
jgi:hypothetical protein